MGKGKKRGQIEKISASGCLRRGKGRRPFPFPEYLSADFARHFFFFFAHADFFHLFSPNAEPGPRLPLNKPLDSRLWLNLTSRLSKESCRRIEQNKFILSGAVF